MSKTAIVVGAGITGLATAYKLILQGYQVTILEKVQGLMGLPLEILE